MDMVKDALPMYWNSFTFRYTVLSLCDTLCDEIRDVVLISRDVLNENCAGAIRA